MNEQEYLRNIKESDLTGAILLISEGKPLNLKAVINDVNWLIEQAEKIEEQQKEIESLKKYKKVLMENSIVRSKAIETYEDVIRDAVSIAEAQGEDFRLEPWCALRDILEAERK